MKHLLYALILAATVAGSTSQAQMPGGGPGLDPVLKKLFGKNNNFTAKAEFSIENAADTGPITAAANFDMLDGKTRMEMDVSQIKGGAIPPAALAMVKQMGMDKMISITLPDKGMTYLTYPNAQAYMEMTNSEASAAQKDMKTEKTSLGKETMDGHACEKNKVVMTDDKGKTHEATVWNASDLKDFPIQIKTTEQGHGITMHFTDIKIAKPEAKLFDPPAGYTKYSDPQAMGQAIMMKKMSSGGGVAPAK